MPKIVPSVQITLNGTGSEFSGLLDVTSTIEIYYIQGSATATANYNISPSGSPAPNTTFTFKYTGNLDITSNSVTFNIFGTSLTQQQLQNHLTIVCYYNGTSWVNTVDVDFSQAGIISSGNLGDIITSSNIIANSLNLHTVGQALSLTNTEIAANTIIGNQKIANTSITDGQILNLNGSKIIAHTIPNSGIATTVASAIKVTDSSGNMQDLAIGNNQIPIGNGTNITTVPISNLSIGQKILITLPINFVNTSLAVQTAPQGNYSIDLINLLITDVVAGTDAGQIQASIYINGSFVPMTGGLITVPASTAAGTYFNAAPSANNITNSNIIQFLCTKTTSGGRGFLQVYLTQLS